MSYTITEPAAGLQAITDHSTTKNHTLGKTVRGNDPVFGSAEFIYLLGVSATVVGSIVTYDASTFQTVLCAVAGGVPRPIAVAMSANLGSEYGWYQISGVAVCKKKSATSFATGVAVGVQSTGVIGATGTGKEISGAVTAAAAASGLAIASIMISRPHKQGRIT